MKKYLHKLRDTLVRTGQQLMPVIQSPFLAADYKNTAFARETGASYEEGIDEAPVFLLFNRLRREGVPIKAVAHPRHALDAHLWWQDTLIIHEIDRVALVDGKWVIGPGSPVWKEGLDLKTAIGEVLDDVFDDQPGFQPENVVLLLERALITPGDRSEAEVMPLFLLYDNEEDRFQVLKAFCK